MKRAVLMAMVFIFPRLLVAQDFNFEALLGDSWYGLYLNGEKAGYALNSASRGDDGQIVLVEDAHFHISMAGVRQEMHILSRRTYLASGDLLTIESSVVDFSSTSEFNARVEGDELVLVSKTGGATKESRLPKPRESLADAMKHARWVSEKPQIGDTLEFYVFEPLYQKEVAGVSRIVGVEERILDGVATKVYTIRSSLDLMGIESVSRVAEDGLTLEDRVAGIIVMRLEPEEIAKDVNYTNDVIVSNAATVNTPVADPRNRKSLRLRLRGPLTQAHLFNDERQYLAASGDHYAFIGHQVSLEGFEAAHLPVEEESLRAWLEPTVFVQSDAPRLQEKAREIVGAETNTLKASNKLCAWVYDHMRSTFSARLTNALEVLDSLEGDCTEHSILFIGLARAIGLPAREVAGVIYVEGMEPGFYFHQWAKVWVGKWIDVDPTFNEPLADVTHIKLAEGDLFEQAKLIPIVGRLKIEVVADEPEAGENEGTPAEPEADNGDRSESTPAQ